MIFMSPSGGNAFEVTKSSNLASKLHDTRTLGERLHVINSNCKCMYVRITTMTTNGSEI